MHSSEGPFALDWPAQLALTLLAFCSDAAIWIEGPADLTTLEVCRISLDNLIWACECVCSLLDNRKRLI